MTRLQSAAYAVLQSLYLDCFPAAALREELCEALKAEGAWPVVADTPPVVHNHSLRGRFPQLRRSQDGPWCGGCTSLAVNGDCCHPCECHAGSRYEREGQA
jgi:hypothetical protein